MQSQQSVVGVAGRSTRRVRPCLPCRHRQVGRTIFIGSRGQVAPRPINRPGADSHSARKPRSGAKRLALTLCVVMLPAVGQAQTIEWAVSAGETMNEEDSAIAVDAAGNSYVTGRFGETATFDAFTLNASGIGDVFVAKFTAASLQPGAIPTVTAWGLMIMTLLLLIGAKVYFNRRRPERG